MSGSNSYVAAEPFNAVPGCHLSGGCRINTCPRDSTCIETLTSKKCECLPGHSGSDCRAFVDCGGKPCQNGGTCVPHPTDRYQCRCKDGYSGTQCHIYTGHCASAPCRNGGSCIPSGESGFICTCPAGVQGKTCEQDTRPCSSNPCANNANCTNHGESYKCHCRAGFSGEICDEGYLCSKDSHCQNGGTCQENQKNSAAVCRCLQGYTGADCSEDVDECASSPCKNGGVCVNQLGNFACNCSASSHGGKLCELVLTSIEARRGWPLGQTEIIGIAVVLAVILLIVFLVVIFLRRRAKRRREKREQAGAVSTSVLKVSPPVVGSEVTSPEPPTPPPREVHGYNVDDLGMPPGYDAEDSWRRREKVRKDFGTMKTLTSLSDNNLPGYQWDYTDIPADLVPRTPLSKEHSGSYSGSPDCATFAPEVPQRPSSFRSSQGSLDVPEVPKRPRNYRVSESEDGYTDVPHVPKKPMEYTNPKGKSASRYSMDSRFSEFSDATDLDPDIFKGRFPRPPREPYPESLDQLPVGSYAPTLTARGSELGSVTDGMYSEDDLEQVYLGNRMEVCDDSPENSYLHSENCSEDEDDDYHRDRYARAATPDPEFHKELQREIKEMMNELEELKLESEI